MHVYVRSRYREATPPERELNCIFSRAIARYARSLGHHAYSPLANAKWWEPETQSKRDYEMARCIRKVKSMKKKGDMIFFTPNWQMTSAGMADEYKAANVDIVYVSYEQIEPFMPRRFRK